MMFTVTVDPACLHEKYTPTLTSFNLRLRCIGMSTAQSTLSANSTSPRSQPAITSSQMRCSPARRDKDHLVSSQCTLLYWLQSLSLLHMSCAHSFCDLSLASSAPIHACSKQGLGFGVFPQAGFRAEGGNTHRLLPVLCCLWSPSDPGMLRALKSYCWGFTLMQSSERMYVFDSHQMQGSQTVEVEIGQDCKE